MASNEEAVTSSRSSSGGLRDKSSCQYDEQSISNNSTSTSASRRKSGIQDVRTRRSTRHTRSTSSSSKHDKQSNSDGSSISQSSVPIFTGEVVDMTLHPTVITPTYRDSEGRLRKDEDLKQTIEEDGRLLRTSSSTSKYNSPITSTSGSGYISGIKSTGMKGGARRVFRKGSGSGSGTPATATATPNSSHGSLSRSSKGVVGAVTPSPRDASRFTFEKSDIKVSLASRRRAQYSEEKDIERAGIGISASTPITAVSKSLASLSLTDDKRKNRLSSGPKRIPRQRSSAKKSSSTRTPSSRLMKATFSSRSKKVQSRHSDCSSIKQHQQQQQHQRSSTDSVEKCTTECQTAFTTPSPSIDNANDKLKTTSQSSPKVSLMNDFADEVMSPSPATIKIPSQKNPKNGLEVDGVVGVAVDHRVEAIRNKLDKSKYNDDADLLDGYLKSGTGSDHSNDSDLVDSFDLGHERMTLTETAEEDSSTEVTPCIPQEEQEQEQGNTDCKVNDDVDSVDLIMERFKDLKTKCESKYRIDAEAAKTSDGRTNPVAKTLTNMDHEGLAVLIGEGTIPFSGGGVSSAFSEL